MIAAVLALSLRCSPAADARPGEAPEDLPRHLALAGSDPGPKPGLPRFPAPPPSQHPPGLLAEFLPLAERMRTVPNPYLLATPLPFSSPAPLRLEAWAPLSVEPPPDDPNDLMGLSLGRGAVLGFHVDMIGPVETPE